MCIKLFKCRLQLINNKTTTMQTTLDFNHTQRNDIWTRLISRMTNEEIERRSLLVGLSPATEENETFQTLLTNEYNKRK